LVDLDQLMRLRVVVARFGEMDLAKWWNTRGQLGKNGTVALRRGFPRTHRFAQARSVFAVAAHRCREVFDVPGTVTLWHLTDSIEEEFDAKWEQWLDHAAEWTPFFDRVASAPPADLPKVLRSFDLVTEGDLQNLAKLRLSSAGRAVPLPGMFGESDSDVALLALGFARGEVGSVAVPYLRRAD